MRGGNAMGNIKVLWMNNGEERLQSYVNEASLNGIDITTCKNPADYKHQLECYAHEWDALMLNYDYLGKDERRQREFRLQNHLNDLYKDKSKPTFVVTDNEVPGPFARHDCNLLDLIFYQLSDSNKLFSNIKEEVEKRSSPEYIVRQKYGAVCDFCHEPFFMKLLVEFNSGDKRFQTDTGICNSCRQVLDWIKNEGVFPCSLQEQMKTLINAEEDFIDIRQKSLVELKLSEFSTVLNRISGVPGYVKRSFHRCSSVCNEGSHYLDTIKLIKDNRVPYLNISLVYDLLNILYWCATLKEEDYV